MCQCQCQCNKGSYGYGGGGGGGSWPPVDPRPWYVKEAEGRMVDNDLPVTVAMKIMKEKKVVEERLALLEEDLKSIATLPVSGLRRLNQNY